MACFADVKEVLDSLAKGHDIPHMKLAHGGNLFTWDTADGLRTATAVIFGSTYRLIDPSMVGNGRADETYLLQVLMGPLDEEGIPRMPYLGPYATGPQIKVIREWINSGALDDVGM